MDTMAMRRSSATAVPTTSTTRPPKETGLHEVFRARSYLNFIDEDPTPDRGKVAAQVDGGMSGPTNV